MPCSVPSTSVLKVGRRPLLSLRRNPGDLVVDHAIGKFLDSLMDGGMRETSVVTQGRQLRCFFRPVLNEPLRNLSNARMQQLTAVMTESPSRKTGALLASETVSFCRETARRFTRWCTAQGRLKADPMAGEPTRVGWLHDEVNRLRKSLANMTRERNQAIVKLRTAGGVK